MNTLYKPITLTFSSITLFYSRKIPIKITTKKTEFYIDYTSEVFFVSTGSFIFQSENGMVTYALVNKSVVFMSKDIALFYD